MWAVIRDIERWPEWTPTVTSIRKIGSGPLAVGSRAVIWQPKLLHATWEITELDDQNKTLIWVTRRLGLRLTGAHWVASTRDGSRATLALQFSGPLGGLFAWLTQSLSQRYLALEAKGLKERAESR